MHFPACTKVVNVLNEFLLWHVDKYCIWVNMALFGVQLGISFTLKAHDFT